MSSLVAALSFLYPLPLFFLTLLRREFSLQALCTTVLFSPPKPTHSRYCCLRPAPRLPCSHPLLYQQHQLNSSIHSHHPPGPGTFQPGSAGTSRVRIHPFFGGSLIHTTAAQTHSIIGTAPSLPRFEPPPASRRPGGGRLRQPPPPPFCSAKRLQTIGFRWPSDLPAQAGASAPRGVQLLVV